MRESLNLFSSSSLFISSSLLLSLPVSLPLSLARLISINRVDWMCFIVVCVYAYMLVRPRTAFTRWLSVGFGALNSTVRSLMVPCAHMWVCVCFGFGNGHLVCARCAVDVLRMWNGAHNLLFKWTKLRKWRTHFSWSTMTTIAAFIFLSFIIKCRFIGHMENGRWSYDETMPAHKTCAHIFGGRRVLPSLLLWKRITTLRLIFFKLWTISPFWLLNADVSLRSHSTTRAFSTLDCCNNGSMSPNLKGADEKHMPNEHLEFSHVHVRVCATCVHMPVLFIFVN